MKLYEVEDKWELNVWYQLTKHDVVVSDYYTVNGPKFRQLQEALHFKLDDLKNITELVGQKCRLQLRRNRSYPRYKILMVLPPGEEPRNPAVEAPPSP